jgi:hypothetical protein
MIDRTQPVRPTAAPWVGKVAVLAGLASAALIVHAVYLDVAIHPFFFTRYVFIPLLFPGLALAVYVLYRKAVAHPPEPFGPRDVVGAVGLPLFIALFFWIVLAKTPVWIAAGLVGTPHSEVHEFYIYYSRSGKYGCRSRAEPTDGLRLEPDYLCVSEDFVNKHYRQRVQLRLIGKRTGLGFLITDFEHETAP